MTRTPGAVGFQILALPAVGVIDAAVQHQFAGAPLDGRQLHLGQQSHRIVIEFAPADGVEVTEQTAGVMVPTPPQIAGQRPKPFLSRGDEAVQRAGFADYGSDLRRRLHHHVDFVVAKSPAFDRLHHQNALQDAAVNQRHAEERLVVFFARLLEIFEARMALRIFDGNR